MESICISVDAMGGDRAPDVILEGLAQMDPSVEARILLVGPPESLSNLPESPLEIELVAAHEVVEPNDSVTVALRKRRKSSMAVAVDLVKRGEAGAVVSLGSTGAFMAFCKTMLGTLDGIKRPAIGVPLPTIEGQSLLIDGGANSDAQPENLRDFALMGKIYSQEVLGCPNPAVGLLSLGEEDSKGNDLTLAASRLIRDLPLDFIGNIEGGDIPKGKADVVVCDGFSGNIMLKFGEGLVEWILGGLKEAVRHAEVSDEAKASMGLALRELIVRTDYSEYGGAPLLGIRGTCIIGHGRSSAKAVANAIRAAHRAVQHAVNDRAVRELTRLGSEEKEKTGTPL